MVVKLNALIHSKRTSCDKRWMYPIHELYLNAHENKGIYRFVQRI